MNYRHANLEEFSAKIGQSLPPEYQEKTRQALEKLSEKTVPFPSRQTAIDTAILLHELKFEPATLLGTLMEPILNEENAKEFDPESTSLAKGLRQTEAILERNFGKIPSETLSKLLIANAKDIRILILTVVKTLAELRFATGTEEDHRTATIALNTLVPICHKLGLHKTRWELEDLAMKQLDPENYAKLKNQLNEKREKRVERLRELESKIKAVLRQNGKNFFVTGRVKNIYRIHKKMQEQNKKLEDIHDLLAVRVICNTIPECYEAFGILQPEFRELKDSFTDYISHPKPNGYQSIHTDIQWQNKSAEIQIRTWDMHKESEDGLSAHWEYRQYAKDPEFDPRLSFAKQISDWIATEKNQELMQTMRIQFEKNKVFVFTPKNDLIELSYGATPLDFAFALHSKIGFKCEKALVNGRLVPLGHVLENGDRVEIITSEKQVPKRSWLSIAQTDKARASIRTALQLEQTATKKPAKQKKIFLPRKKPIQIRLAKCCNPLPGEETIAIKTTKRKIVIHRKECENCRNIPATKLIEVGAEQFPKKAYSVEIRILAANKPGILASILNEFAKINCTVQSTNAITKAEQFSCRFTIQIKKAEDLKKALERISKIKGIQKVRRG